MENSLYSKVVQEYLSYQAEKRNLLTERNVLNVKIDLLDGILIDLNDILCKHGNHVYEHFVESVESVESEGNENDR